MKCSTKEKKKKRASSNLTVGKGAPPYKNDTMKQTYIIKGWDEIYATRTVLFEMFIFNT